jgi:diguanylate cyclase (GGDEF)-like protein
MGERIRRRIANATAGSEGEVTVSIGIASCPRDGTDYDTLFERADKRLYEAKSGGRNCVVDGRVSSDTHVRLVAR